MGTGKRGVLRGGRRPRLNSVVCRSVSGGNGVGSTSHAVVKGPFPGVRCSFGLKFSCGSFSIGAF